MPTVPPAIATPPTAPSRSDPANFVTEADAWVAWLEAEAPDIGTAATRTYDNAIEAYGSAQTAAAAANGVGAALWVSGTSYSIGDVRRSPITYFPYRRLTSGAGTTDPSADVTNWAPAAPGSPVLQEVTGTSVNAQNWAHYFLTNAAASTVTLPASPGTGDSVWVTVGNGRTDNVIARNGKNIMSLAEDMTLDAVCTIQLRYFNATLGWRMT